MRRFKDLSLRVKVTLVTTLVAGTALALDGAAVLVSTWWGFRETGLHDLTSRADIVAGNCTAAIAFNDRASAAETLKGLAVDDQVLAACVYGRDGRPFAEYHRVGAAVAIPPAAGGPRYNFDEGQLNLVRPIVLDHEVIGSIWLAWDWGRYRSRLLVLSAIVLTMMIVSLGIAAFLSTKLQRVFTQPILELVETARRISAARDYTARAHKHAQDELGALTDAFNEMLNQIQQRDGALRWAYDDLEERVHERTVQLREAKELAECADRAKSEFLANMSHEIRTPMTAILGFAEVLAELEPAGHSTTEQTAAVGAIRRNGMHLLDLINEILDLSKIEAGKMTVDSKRFPFPAFLAEIQSLLQVRAAEKGLSLNVQFIGPVPETIETDPLRLRQILINLLGNAIKFTETGCVQLEVRLLESPTARPMIQFDVVDSGIGMTSDQIARLFQAFSQGDSSASRKFGGTGLGLLISKRLAELLGGNVAVVDSTPGVGTRFRATVPAGLLSGVRMLDPRSSERFGPERLTAEGMLLPAAGSADVRVPSAGPALACRVLVADDGADNRLLISRILGKAGADVTLAENGRLAIAKALAAEAAGRSFDVILIDVQMPEVDGHEAARRLRRAGYERPIIALTAHAMSGDREKCIQAGCDDYTTKPINSARLIEMVRAYACSEPLTAPAATNVN